MAEEGRNRREEEDEGGKRGIHFLTSASPSPTEGIVSLLATAGVEKVNSGL